MTAAHVRFVAQRLVDLVDNLSVGTLTDISNQRAYEAAKLEHAREREAEARKKAEDAEERRQEADQRRRAQGEQVHLRIATLSLTLSAELLIDVTSHELRQPVSAILNCSGLVRTDLIALLDDMQGTKEGATLTLSPERMQSMHENIDALDAIYQCGLAQGKRAV